MPSGEGDHEQTITGRAASLRAPIEGSGAVRPPVIGGLYADPALVEFGGRFYLYPTTDGYPDWSATSFHAFSSDDLVDWHSEGEIFSVAKQTCWADGRAWAPAAAYRNGRYYLYFSAEENIGVAVSKSPTGPFQDLGRPLVAADQFTGVAIDPSVFVDADGSCYLLWGNSVAHLAPLNDDMMSFDPSLVISWEPTGFREAPHIHRYADTYVLSWSENDTREEDYRVRYATSRSVHGPWIDRGFLVRKRPEHGIVGTGHHSIMRIPESEWWVIAYHRFADLDGNGYRRQIAVDVFRHSPDGTIPEITPASTSIQDIASLIGGRRKGN